MRKKNVGVVKVSNRSTYRYFRFFGGHGTHNRIKSQYLVCTCAQLHKKSAKDLTSLRCGLDWY